MTGARQTPPPSARSGCASRTASSSSSTASTSRSPREPCLPCSGRTAPARRPPSSILSTLIAADGGEVHVAGHDVRRDPDAVRAAIGVTGQFSAVDSLLTGEENLILMADLRHLGKREGPRRVAELLERFDLVEAARKPIATYSGGMRRRLDLAMTLVGDPRIIFLDEPTAGLDPRSRRVMWQIVRELVATRRHDLPDDAVPRGGRPARPSDRRPRPRASRRRRDAGRAEAPGPGWPYPPRIHRCRRARRGPPATFDGRHARRRDADAPGPGQWRRGLTAEPARHARSGVDRRRRAVRPDAGSRRRLPVAHRPHEKQKVAAR